MAKQGGSLSRGRRRRDEVSPVPPEDGLTATQRRAQARLGDMVEAAGGRLESGPRIGVSHVELLADLFDEWADVHGEGTQAGLYFNGHPGLWHALDELYPLQDPNRWDALRKAVISHLEDRHWTRRSPPRGITFDIRR